MSNGQQERPDERDEIEALLPWYVSGKLDASSRARVERYLDRHPDTRAHLALVGEESEATIAANESISAPGREALDRLRASIAAAPRSQPLWAHLNERLADWISGLAPPQLGMAAAVAALVLMLQAAAIGALLLERTATLAYQTASDQEVPAGGTELLIGFSETATVGEVSALLKQLDAVVVDGPRAGLYRIRIPDHGTGRSEAAIEILKKSGVVTSVLSGR